MAGFRRNSFNVGREEQAACSSFCQLPTYRKFSSGVTRFDDHILYRKRLVYGRAILMFNAKWQFSTVN
ncbi:hypothetical protein [Roseovarius sp. 2305UL8-3]|uniref:hypothetical protein n=1 Tax=Roseovarius conchicola TaxID=3121636 RepID=UPI003527269E